MKEPLLSAPVAERAVLASLLRIEDPARTILKLSLSADLFSLPHHRRMFVAMLDILADGVPLDFPTLEQHLDPADLADLDNMQRESVSDANLAHHACLLNDCHRRRLQKNLRDRAAKALVSGAGFEEVKALLEYAEDPALARVYARTREAFAKADLTCAADIQAQAVRWLWEGWLAEGKIHLIAGPSGTGKTTTALAFAATLSSGGRWPSGELAEARNVVIWTGEDDPADTIKPRLLACEANTNRVYIVNGVSDAGGKRSFDPAVDVPALRDTLLRLGNVGLLIVDPIVSAVAGDSHKNGEVRRSLQPLVDLAMETRCAVLGITHFSKATTGLDPVERVTGSVAFGALARLVLAVVKASPEQGGGRLLVRAKSNLGPDTDGYRFDLRQTEYADGVVGSYVAWGEALKGEARDLLAKAERLPDDGDRSEVEEVKDFLKELLANGPVDAKDVREEADGFGHAWRTVERAKKEIGVLSRREGFGKQGKFWWELPPISQMSLV